MLKICCRGFDSRAQSLGYATPSGFGGLYSLDARADFAGLMRQWLTQSQDGGLLMCHPGSAGADCDSIGTARQQELAYLLSEEFLLDCQSANVRLGRMPPAVDVRS